MTIALVAHNEKKELMCQFCTAYKAILSKHTLIGTSTTARQVEETTGLTVEQYLSGSQGGVQQLATAASCDVVNILFFFRNPFKGTTFSDQEMELFHICDTRNIPYATNIATAESLILALERGDLDWLNIGNPLA